jgi:pyruvate,water dikinase
MKNVLMFSEIDGSLFPRVGGKGAHLAELSRIEGIRVPAGFVVTNDATDDEILAALAQLGENAAYAVRSSATAEDMPTASFAGQYDTFLDVVGPAAILEHVAQCRASLFTERAIAYRASKGLDESQIRMAVVVQRMVPAEVSGVMFTADPVNGNRKVASIDATFGLGEALVSGRVTPDTYKVRDGAIVSTSIVGDRRALSEPQVVKLADLGRRIEAHFGRPQDIEWCLVGDDFHFVQARPITTLFPIPAAPDDAPRVYLSTGHQQMMTDAMKPLGISMWQMSSVAQYHVAAGRLFVDVSRAFSVPASRAAMVAFFKKGDPLWGDALEAIANRGFIPEAPAPEKPAWQPPAAGAPTPIENDPAIVADLIRESEAKLEETKREIASKSGPALFEFIAKDIEEKKRLLTDPRSTQALMAGIDATWALNDKLEAWLGEKNAALTLAESAPNNITSEMGLALLDVADAIRDDKGADVLNAWLDKYGVRGVGEIDITRPRWTERPSMLDPLILSNIRTFKPGEAKRRFEKGLREAAAKEKDILQRLRALPDGEGKATEAKWLIDRLRTFVGYREYPKYAMIARYFVYKQALMKEIARLVRHGVLGEEEDAFFLTFQELAAVVRTSTVDKRVIDERKEAFKYYETLTPPRIITSEGEVITGAYHRDAPDGVLVGLGVSAGTVEGRARVVTDFGKATFEPGDILVTPFTDPSWTPVFVSIAGLVTEVGGLMTHGAVVAREYGLPAVVGVVDAMRLIRDGQRIRVDGTHGYVELLS